MFTLAYIDDVNIYSPNFDQHLMHVNVVLKRLREANLKLNPDKCFWGQKKFSFLGHEVSCKGIVAAESKVAAVNNYPRPKNLRTLRGFLGLAGYY